MMLRLVPLAVFVALLGVAGCNDSRGSRVNAGGTAASATGSGPAQRVVAMARGTVEISGGLLEIGAPQDGIVDSVAVQEGEVVERGQVLLQLASEPLRQELAMAEAELRLARVRQAAQQARLPAAADLARRTAEAAAAGAVDAQVADDAERNLRDAEAGAGVARAESAVALQKTVQIRSQEARLTLRAAEAGQVIRLQVRPGARVFAQAGRPLITLLPARPLRIRAELNEAFLPRVAIGMQANVRPDTDGTTAAVDPGGAVQAKVVRLSPLFANSRLDDEAQPRGRTRVVECVLEFDRPPSLRVGQTVRVEFHE